MVHTEGTFTLGICDGVNISAIFFIHVLNKYLSPLSQVQSFNINHSNVAWSSKFLNLYSPKVLIKSLQV